MFNHQRLRCYRMALEVAQRMPALTGRWPKGSGYLEDQLKRALASVLLNTAEGNARSSPRERARFFTIARASAAEVAACIDIAVAYRMMPEAEGAEVQDMLLQVVRMLSKLP